MKPKADHYNSSKTQVIYTNLRLRHHCVLSVTERGKLQPLLLLLVSLLEELLHAPGGPLVVQVPSLGWMRHVTGVKE